MYVCTDFKSPLFFSSSFSLFFLYFTLLYKGPTRPTRTLSVRNPGERAYIFLPLHGPGQYMHKPDALVMHRAKSKWPHDTAAARETDRPTGRPRP